MPLVKLTIREEPFEVGEDEVETLRSQGLLEAGPEPPKPEPPKPTPPAAAVQTQED